ATSPRRALPRAAFDVAVAGAFALYRLVVAPVQESTGFVVHRTVGAYFDRALDTLRGGWRSFDSLYLTSDLAWVLAVAGIAVVTAACVLRADARRPIRSWLVLGGIAVLFAAAAVLAYITSNDYYIPQTGGTFNR